MKRFRNSENLPDEDPPSQESLVLRHLKRLIRIFSSWLPVSRGAKERHSIDKLIAQKQSDRVEQLQSAAAEVLKQLGTVRKNAELSTDQAFVQQVDGAVQELSSRVKRMTKQLHLGEEHLERLEKMRQVLVHQPHSSKNQDEAVAKVVVDRLEQFMVEDTLQMVETQIATDLRVVEGELESVLSRLDAVSGKKKRALQERIGATVAYLTDIIKHWKELKTPPEQQSLEEISIWKKKVDDLRAHYSEETIRVMDAIEHVLPFPSSTDSSSLLLHKEKIVMLEEETYQLLREVEDELIDLSKEMRLGLQRRQELLLIEIHLLQQDLLLPPELFTRLQRVEEQLRELVF